MKNIAIIPDVLSATDELMTSICKKLPTRGTPDDVLHVITSHKSDIKRLTKKTLPLIAYLDLQDKIDEKYSEIRTWSRENTDFALPVVAWNYFVHSIANSTEDSLVSNVVAIIPIVDRSFKDYFIEQVH